MAKINMYLDPEEEKTIEFLKYEYGIKQTTELIRFLVRQDHKRFLLEKKDGEKGFPPKRPLLSKELEQAVETWLREQKDLSELNRLKKEKNKEEEEGFF